MCKKKMLSLYDCQEWSIAFMDAKNGFLTKFCIEIVIRFFFSTFFFNEKRKLREKRITIPVQNFVRNLFLASINATEHFWASKHWDVLVRSELADFAKFEARNRSPGSLKTQFSTPKTFLWWTRMVVGWICVHYAVPHRAVSDRANRALVWFRFADFAKFNGQNRLVRRGNRS